MRLSRFKSLPVAVALAGSIAGCHQQKPAPSIDGLTEALQQSAEKALAPPSLANEQIVLPARTGKIDAQAGEVLAAASASGGVAIRSLNAQGQVSILATIPENNVEAFKATLRHEKSPMDSPSSSTTLIEVLIENTTASPTP